MIAATTFGTTPSPDRAAETVARSNRSSVEGAFLHRLTDSETVVALIDVVPPKREQFAGAPSSSASATIVRSLTHDRCSNRVIACSTVNAHFGRTVLRRGISTPSAGFVWRWPHFTPERSTALNTSWT